MTKGKSKVEATENKEVVKVTPTVGTESKGVMHVGRASDEQIEKWRLDLEARGLEPEVHEICVDIRKNGKEMGYGYVHEPERIHIAKVMTHMAKGEIVQAGEYIINNLWLGGDKRLQNEKWPAFNAAMQASAIVDFRETTIKKR